MTRASYARPADGYRGRVLTRKPPMKAEETLTPILAAQLRVGDQIIRDGFIPQTVTEPPRHACGIVHYAYDSIPGAGYQAFVDDTPLTVRRSTEAGH